MREDASLCEAGRPALRALRDTLVARLLAARTDQGVWEGHLASSALATAVAVFALHRIDPGAHRERVSAGLRWLVDHAHADGGWGDTPLNRSHPSTTLLCRAALGVAPPGDAASRQARDLADGWLAERAGASTPEALAGLVMRTYGRDRTFSVPILVLCALAGLLGPEPDAWRRIPVLPFELAALPASWYRFAGLPVVSYALPALIAMGLLQHRRSRSRLPGFGALRDRVAPGLLGKLAGLQPASGGFLEAAPLTAFVAVSLAAAGEGDHPVVRRGVDFLVAGMRPDGSWPIDTHLKTWVTTLSVQALGEADGVSTEAGCGGERVWAVRDWLLRTQHTARHPYTGAAPGGWSWTDLPGGVPDVDDTAGAVLALHRVAGEGRPDAACLRAACAGVVWLMDMQNRDGGLPTFCRGWGRLPFDRSCPDLTAHAIAALSVWLPLVPSPLASRMRTCLRRALHYLARTQHADGSWVPLWFGNERTADGANRTYGTATVILGLSRLPTDWRHGGVADMRAAGLRWLRAQGNGDGGWGGGPGAPSSVEETALAVHALAVSGVGQADPAVHAGVGWLARTVADGADMPCAPIGLYFASLWYWERLYPLIYATGAIRAVVSADPKRE